MCGCRPNGPPQSLHAAGSLDWPVECEGDLARALGGQLRRSQPTGADASTSSCARATVADGQILLTNVQGTGPAADQVFRGNGRVGLVARDYDLTVDYERVALAATAVPSPARARLARAWNAVRGSVARRGWTEAPETRRVQWHGTWDLGRCRAGTASPGPYAGLPADSDRLTAMRVAAIQMTSGHDIEANLEAAGRFLAEAARLGAVLAALPENFAFMGKDSRRQARHRRARRGGHASRTSLQTPRGASRYGSSAERCRCARTSDGRVSASCLVYDAAGTAGGALRQDAPVRRGRAGQHRVASRIGAHGGRVTTRGVVDTPIGKLGLAVCYDMRFPELFRVMSRQGAEVFVVPSAFTVPTGRAHWESLLRARAIENLCGLIAPAQWGVHPSGRETFGDSMIIDHWGKVLARMPGGTGCVVADLDPAARMDARTRFPALEHRVIYNT